MEIGTRPVWSLNSSEIGSRLTRELSNRLASSEILPPSSIFTQYCHGKGLVGRHPCPWLRGMSSVGLHLQEDNCVGPTIMPSGQQAWATRAPRSGLGMPRWSRTIQHREKAPIFFNLSSILVFVNLTIISVDDVHQPNRNNRHVWLRQQTTVQTSSRSNVSSCHRRDPS
jgi:hypothetical protein